MGLRITKVDQEAITKILGNVTLERLDDLGTGDLVGTDDLTPLFRVELASKAGGVHDITKHDRELASFRLRAMACSGAEFPLRGVIGLLEVSRGSRVRR